MAINGTGKIENRDVSWDYKLEPQHTVGNVHIFGKDIDLQRRMMWEACTHSGYYVEYFEAEVEERDLYQDPVVTWKPAIILPCIFEDHPKVKVLKELGWYTDDTELSAPIIYLSVYRNWETKEILDLKDQSMFRITYFGQNYPVDFRLSNKQMDSVYGTYWVCKLAPEHLDNFVYITDHGTHYLKKREDTTVECEHEKEVESGEVEVQNRVFQNEDTDKYVEFKEGEKLEDSLPKYKDLITDQRPSYSQLIMEDDDE